MKPSPILLSVSELNISFPESEHFHAVKELSFNLKKGKSLAIVGESGSGKSLIALSLMGLQPKGALLTGQIEWHTEKASISLLGMESQAWTAIRGKDLSMVFQEPMTALNPIIAVGKQLQECILQHQKCNKRQAKAIALKWLEKVKLPSVASLYKRYPHQLSGGQKQRVMIAMAMCNKPSVLIADEPTTALDATVQQDIVGLMKALQEETQTALVFITHDLALAAQVSDEIMVMQQGQMIEWDNSEIILHQPQMPYTKALLSCRPKLSNKGKKLPIIADYLKGAYVPQALPKEEVCPKGSILKVDNLNVWYPEQNNLWGKPTCYFKAVNDISFSLTKGQTIGLVGESGCGKSTISKALMGLSPIHSGSVRFMDKEIGHFKGKQWNEARKALQLIFQDPYASLNPRHSVATIISEPLKIYHKNTHYNTEQEVKRLLSLVQLPQSAASRYPHQFSGGQRQRIGIARALALHPQLLICDESVSALDLSVQAQILNLLKELQHELSLSYIFISHDLSVVHYMSDEILVMREGQIVERGNADDILLHPKEAYTQSLIKAIPTL